MNNKDEIQVNSADVPTEEAENNNLPDLLFLEEGIDTVISTIYVYQDKLTERLRTVLWEQSPELRATGMLEFPVETKWSVPTKAQIDGYRDRSSRYNPTARAVLVQRSKLEELLVQNHLLEMKLGSGERQTIVGLQKDRKGILTSDSLAYINRMHPSVIELIITKFIDEAALIL